MSRRPAPMGEYEDRRNARIRQLREQREGPMRRRRRVQPLLLVAWIAGSIALLVVLIVLGFNVLFAPRVMAWVEENPGRHRARPGPGLREVVPAGGARGSARQ